MRLIETALKDVVIVEPDVHHDHRGCFMELYHRKRYEDFGLTREFVQDNVTVSNRHTLRGLHFQVTQPQAKLVQVLDGEVYDVVVDVRRGSPDFGRWVSVTLSGENRRQLFIPEGYAHGFCVVSESAIVHYKCSAFYNPHDEQGVLWADTWLDISWPVQNPVLSEKDKSNPPLKQILVERLPVYE